MGNDLDILKFYSSSFWLKIYIILNEKIILTISAQVILYKVAECFYLHVPLKTVAWRAFRIMG